MNSQISFDVLGQSKLAAELSPEQARILAKLVTLHELKDGEILVKEGESDSHLYVIVDGRISVVKNAGNRENMVLFDITAGNFADELSFMDGAVHYASLVARGDTRVLGLERDKLESLLP